MTGQILFLNYSRLSDREAMRLVADNEPSLFDAGNRRNSGGFGFTTIFLPGGDVVIDYQKDRKRRLKIIVRNAT